MTSTSSTRLHHDRGGDLQFEITINHRTRELSWVFTRGMSWHGFPELVVPVPADPPGDSGGLAVFLGAGLITLGRCLLGTNDFVDAGEVRPYTAFFGNDAVTLWVAGPGGLERPVPPELLASDVLLVGCSLWDAQPSDTQPSDTQPWDAQPWDAQPG